MLLELVVVIGADVAMGNGYWCNLLCKGASHGESLSEQGYLYAESVG